MLNKIIQKAMDFLQRPKKAYDKEKTTDVSDAFVYIIILYLVVAVLSAVVSLVTEDAFLAGITLVSVYVGGIILSIIAGLWLHLWVYIFGAKKGLNQTLKTVFYAGTPSYLLGWIPIPYISLVFWLWSLYLNWIGLQKLQGMKEDKVVYALLIAFVIPMILAWILAYALATYVLNAFGPELSTGLSGF